ncbi:MAG: HAD family phosphatase [Pseudomonadota bacterium]
MSVRPRHVVFDLGGVLIDWNPRHLYREMIDDEAVMEDFLANVCTQAWNSQQDAGRSTAEATAILVGQFPEHRDLIEAYYGQFERMWNGTFDDTVAIVAELRNAGVPLFGLTNWSAETFPVAEERFGFLRWFDDIVVSGREGIIKPDPAIFHLSLERFGLKADETLFIDDTASNAEAASSLGFHTHHYIGPETLRRDLQMHGLL